MVLPLCDVIGYCGFSLTNTQDVDLNSPRYLFFKPDETLEAKDRTGVLPDKCLLDADHLKKCFEGGAPAKVATKPTPNVVKKIIRK
jgi:hypothetical protein